MDRCVHKGVGGQGFEPQTLYQGAVPRCFGRGTSQLPKGTVTPGHLSQALEPPPSFCCPMASRKALLAITELLKWKELW